MIKKRSTSTAAVVKRLPRVFKSGGVILYSSMAFMLLSGAFAAYEVEMLVSKMKINADEKGVAKISLLTEAATEKEYQQILGRITNISSDVEYKATPLGLEVFAKNQEAYPDWMFSLNSIPTLDKDLRWEIEEMCVGANCVNGAVYAKLKAVKFKVTKS